MPSPEEVAEHIEFLKDLYAASSFAILALNDDAVLAHFENVRGLDPGSSIRLGRADDSYYEGIDFWQSVDRAQSPEFNLTLMAGLLSAAVSWVGDQLATETYFDDRLPPGTARSPRLEFLRHLRNALSHGNRWHFTNGEPRRPAALGSIVLDASLHGTDAVLFEQLGPGDVFQLLDEVAAALRA